MLTKAMMDQFISGLDTSNVYKTVRQHPAIMKQFFVQMSSPVSAGMYKPMHFHALEFTVFVVLADSRNKTTPRSNTIPIRSPPTRAHASCT